MFTTITRDNGTSTSEFANEWRTNKIPGRRQTSLSNCFSNFSHTLWFEVTQFDSTAQSRVTQAASIDFSNR